MVADPRTQSIHQTHQANDCLLSLQRSHRNIPVPDGIRGLAVIIAFASHSSDIFFHGELSGFGAGQLGVMLFFVLSGILMAYLYTDEPTDAFSQW